MVFFFLQARFISWLPGGLAAIFRGKLAVSFREGKGNTSWKAGGENHPEKIRRPFFFPQGVVTTPRRQIDFWS